LEQHDGIQGRRDKRDLEAQEEDGRGMMPLGALRRRRLSRYERWPGPTRSVRFRDWVHQWRGHPRPRLASRYRRGRHRRSQTRRLHSPGPAAAMVGKPDESEETAVGRAERAGARPSGWGFPGCRLFIPAFRERRPTARAAAAGRRSPPACGRPGAAWTGCSRRAS